MIKCIFPCDVMRFSRPILAQQYWRIKTLKLSLKHVTTVRDDTESQ